MSEGKIPDFFKLFKGAEKKEDTKPTVQEMKEEAEQAKKLYEEIRKYRPSTLLAVLEIVAINECWFVDGLLEVIRGAHHAQHSGAAEKAKELMGLVNLLDAMKKEQGNDPRNS